ncbi:hypothetical protein [Aliirhizobium smilacinae]|jgi:hypothetical protein|uniref:Uncharacterized protein n=1 Tax=Aliirhizobium smilacinae TaxID=1395944 RepID=A0A5C4XP84_9HYPH|nr:hypothetical protein [Rhizobium smilacinae]TNM65295.1 hypothetical protein FHP24_03165 [Rhizobium smilacinae]
MPKVFHGPFRITGADVSIGRDGDVFVHFKDEKNNVIGAVFAVETVIELSQVLEAAAVQLSPARGVVRADKTYRVSME